MQKHVQILDPLLSFMISFQTCKVHNMLAMLLTTCYKGLGLFNMLARRGLFKLQVSEAYMYCSCSLFMHTSCKTQLR
jgi:hypothetical protein